MNENIGKLTRYYKFQHGDIGRTPTVELWDAVLAVMSDAKFKRQISAWTHDEKAGKDLVGLLESTLEKAGGKTPEGTTPTSSWALSEKAPVEVPQETLNLTLSLNKILSDLLGQVKNEGVTAAVTEAMKEDFDSYVLDKYGVIEKKVNLVVDGKAVPLEGVLHKKFDTVLQFVSQNEPVFLTGPAGCGKNVLCQQVAKALELDFYFSNAVTQEYKITGFTDAMGTFHESQFYKAFKNGGLFMLDEMDASVPEVLIILNAAIANRYFDFPAPIGYVEAHPDFRIVAAGNTFGLGADYDYVGRNQLDMASLDRFAVVPVDYDKAIELHVSDNNTELVDFCRDFRESCLKAGVKSVVSYRAISRLAKMLKSLVVEDAIQMCLTKGLSSDDLKSVLEHTSCKNSLNSALKVLTKPRFN